MTKYEGRNVGLQEELPDFMFDCNQSADSLITDHPDFQLAW